MEGSKYCVAVMSVGSGIGQSVITSCNLSNMPLKTIGLTNDPFSFGAYECDVIDYVPNIYSEDYISELTKKCKEYKIDVIIPGLDDEALILSKHIDKFKDLGIEIIASDEKLIKLIRDKEKMTEKLNSYLKKDLFVKSYNKEDLNGLLKKGEIDFPLLAKPRDGSSSKGIEILLEENDLNKINKNHIIQELAVPHQDDPNREEYMKNINNRVNAQLSEISVQVVRDKNGEVIGKMASYNKLKNGVPIEIIPYENQEVWQEIDKILPILKELGHKGPVNIQGRLTDKGLRLFEINTRFTGITGLRAIMGFNEVESCIKSWLNIEEVSHNSLKINNDKFGLRQTMDRAISFDNNEKVKKISKLINKKILKTKKNILITGSSGYLGQIITKKLAEENYNVLAFSRNKDKIEKIFKKFSNISCYDNKDLNFGSLNLGQVDYIIHAAFARPYKGEKEIADSLKFTSELFRNAVLQQVPYIINISSQSVYGTTQPIKWAEETSVRPETSYAQAKYAGELMLENACSLNKHTYGTSLRLSTLTGGQEGLIPVEVMAKFTKRALNNEVLQVIDGSQKAEILDVRDAADAVISLLKTNPKNWSYKYNVGINKNYTIQELAEGIKTVGEDKYDLDIKIENIPKKVDSSFGMNSDRFYNLTGWKPKFDLNDTILSLYDYLS